MTEHLESHISHGYLEDPQGVHVDSEEPLSLLSTKQSKFVLSLSLKQNSGEEVGILFPPSGQMTEFEVSNCITTPSSWKIGSKTLKERKRKHTISDTSWMDAIQLAL